MNSRRPSFRTRNPEQSHLTRTGLSIGFIAESPSVAVSKVFFDDGKDFAGVKTAFL